MQVFILLHLSVTNLPAGRWLPLLQQTNSYDLVYKWFNYLKTQGHSITGYVIMPNHIHIHVLIGFSTSTKKLNTVIGDGKRFIAYDIIKRLREEGEAETLTLPGNAVQSKDKANGHPHEVWKESFVPKMSGGSIVKRRSLLIRSCYISIITLVLANGSSPLILRSMSIAQRGIIFQENMLRIQ
jgi:hypothetical protein